MVKLAMPVFTCQHLIVVGFMTFGLGFYAFLASTIGPAFQHGTPRAVFAKVGMEICNPTALGDIKLGLS